MENECIHQNQNEIDVINDLFNDIKTSVHKQENSLYYLEKTGGFSSKPNWPPFFPIFHYDVLEISYQYRYLLNDAYFCWKFFLVSLTFNFFCCISTSSAPKLVNIFDPNLLISFLYIIILPFISFDLVNISIFEKFLITHDILIQRKTLCTIFLNCALCFFFSLGIRYSGSNGIITLIDLYLEKRYFASFLSGISTFLFLASSLFYFRLYFIVYISYQ